MRVEIRIIYDDGVCALIYDFISLPRKVMTMTTYEEIDAHALQEVGE